MPAKKMRYFRKANNKVHGYDDTDESQRPLIALEIAAGSTEVTGEWPLPVEIKEPLAAAIRSDRALKMAAIAWRYERHARETRIGLPTTDNLAALDAYMQALADITDQPGFPQSVAWPVLP